MCSPRHAWRPFLGIRGSASPDRAIASRRPPIRVVAHGCSYDWSTGMNDLGDVHSGWAALPVENSAIAGLLPLLPAGVVIAVARRHGPAVRHRRSGGACLRKAGRTVHQLDRDAGSIQKPGRPAFPLAPGSWMDAWVWNRIIASKRAEIADVVERLGFRPARVIVELPPGQDRQAAAFPDNDGAFTTSAFGCRSKLPGRETP